MSSWSQTKKHLENLFDPGMKLTLDHDFVLRSGARKDGVILWRYKSLYYYDPATYYIIKLFDDYKNRPLKDIFEPFDHDIANIVDVLRACDRRIGRNRLIMHSFFLEGNDNPARKALSYRFNR